MALPQASTDIFFDVGELHVVERLGDIRLPISTVYPTFEATQTAIKHEVAILRHEF